MTKWHIAKAGAATDELAKTYCGRRATDYHTDYERAETGDANPTYEYCARCTKFYSAELTEKTIAATVQQEAEARWAKEAAVPELRLITAELDTSIPQEDTADPEQKRALRNFAGFGNLAAHWTPQSVSDSLQQRGWLIGFTPTRDGLAQLR